MKILINDFVQKSDVPATLRSPALADKWLGSSITITFDSSKTVDCIGIGYTDATQIVIGGNTIALSSVDKNGLYVIPAITGSSVGISHNGTYIGRLAMGKSRDIGISPAREPGFYSTHENRITLSGQVIPGAGGYTGRKIEVDVRYKIESTIFADFEQAYKCQIGRLFPFFLLFDREMHRVPWERFYGYSDVDAVFQSSVNRFLYSKKLAFREAF